jgi:ABC-type antimicrobial peptide transport system permease subunit
VLSYFVNEFRLGDRTTPYSFITAVGRDQKDDEISINSWLAEDLGAKIGDQLKLRYYVIGERRDLVEQSAEFRVAKIAPLESDSSWMPPFPGLAEVGNCRDWEPGIPIATDRIRPKDEDYWNKYRGSPKAFVTLAAGQRLWANRFGNLTAVRYPAGASVEPALRAALDPATLGLFFVPVRSPALEASRQSLDFGQLFIGFSFFLIVAALMLTAMLYVFNLQQRQEEVGLLRALGFRPRQVQRILLLEGLGLAAVGTALGIGAGVLYTKVTLLGLSTVWRNAVGAAQFGYRAHAGTLLLGSALSLAAAAGAMWLAQRGFARRAPAQLIGGGAELESSRAKGRLGLWLAVVGGIGTVASSFSARGGANPDAFFGAGACQLLVGIGLCQYWLSHLTRSTRLARSLPAIGRRNATRRRGRSLTTIGVLASGVFLVVAVNAFHQDPSQGPHDRSGGTGGFTFYAQSALPIYEDLNSSSGRELYGLAGESMRGVRFVSLRVRDGDDASCLNLNRAIQPRLLGVRVGEFQSRKAFNFAGKGQDWSLLERQQPDGAVPAIGDEPTVTWALGKNVGDTLPYTDERGRTFTIRIVGMLSSSILQGSLVISEKNFIQRFPGTSGFRTFLIDAPRGQLSNLAASLSRALQDRGLEVVPTQRRLADFLEVENTYLAIFQALGGLGLLLGSLGLGIVVLRNVLERRGELALLQAVGFSRPALRQLVLSEHWPLILLGVGIGVASALLAVLPSLRSGGSDLPKTWLGAVIFSLALGGMLWSWLAAWAALRGPLLPALRNE